ncbi:MAG TPA: hypothetical protein VMU09_12435 [Acidimicrobiales bacterium]|nr:hypothetical protein [Acidimicrobiales bacterium]
MTAPTSTKASTSQPQGNEPDDEDDGTVVVVVELLVVVAGVVVVVVGVVVVVVVGVVVVVVVGAVVVVEDVSTVWAGTSPPVAAVPASVAHAGGARDSTPTLAPAASATPASRTQGRLRPS